MNDFFASPDTTHANPAQAVKRLSAQFLNMKLSSVLPPTSKLPKSKLKPKRNSLQPELPQSLDGVTTSARPSSSYSSHSVPPEIALQPPTPVTPDIASHARIGSLNGIAVDTLDDSSPSQSMYLACPYIPPPCHPDCDLSISPRRLSLSLNLLHRKSHNINKDNNNNTTKYDYLFPKPPRILVEQQVGERNRKVKIPRWQAKAVVISRLNEGLGREEVERVCRNFGRIAMMEILDPNLEGKGHKTGTRARVYYSFECLAFHALAKLKQALEDAGMGDDVDVRMCEW